MGRVIFLLEEPSMKAFLLEYLPRLVPGWIHEQHFLLVTHQGKSDLDLSLSRKLRCWREPGVTFVVMRDNDGADCRALKARLLALCNASGRQALVRLICQELEAWYLGDVNALEQAYPDAAKAIRRLAIRFPDPDTCLKPSHELERDVPIFQKQDAARRLGRLLRHDTNRSASLRAFSLGVERLTVA
jgi:Domain of unknown function (DUF4276)